MSREIDKATRKASGGGDGEIVWIAMPPWAISPAVRERLPVGVSWANGDCFVRHLDGTVVGVVAGGVSSAPPKADVEAAGRRLLEDAIAQRAAAAEQARHTHEQAVIAAEAERLRLRVEAIEQRYAAGGLSAVSHAEMREAAVYRRGEAWVAEREREVRKRIQREAAERSDTVNPQTGAALAGGTEHEEK